MILAFREGKPDPEKSHCHLHASPKQRLDAVYKLRFQHDIKTLCLVLRVNRSTCCKHFSANPPPLTGKNQRPASLFLRIYADYSKRPGACKTAYVLQRDYGISISVGRVYRLMKNLQLPKMSTSRPGQCPQRSDSENCPNHLQRQFRQKAPTSVWAGAFTCFNAGGRWYYLCVITDLFSRKIIAWYISAKPDVDLVMNAFQKAYEKRNTPYGLMFHSDRGTRYTAFAFRQLLDSLLPPIPERLPSCFSNAFDNLNYYSFYFSSLPILSISNLSAISVCFVGNKCAYR